MNGKKAIPVNSTKTNLWLDIGLFAAMMLTLTPALTGMTVHEWLGLALGVAATVHLLLHWQWTVAVVRRFFGHLAASTRLNLALNIALFVNFVVVVFTGIMISREALPVLGISLAGGHAWEGIHRQAADLILFVAGLHVAIHWKWILSATRRYLVAPVYGLLHRPAFAAPTGPAIVVARQEVK